MNKQLDERVGQWTSSLVGKWKGTSVISRGGRRGGRDENENVDS